MKAEDAAVLVGAALLAMLIVCGALVFIIVKLISECP